VFSWILQSVQAGRDCSSVSSVPSSKVSCRLLRVPVSEVSGRQHLHSACRRKLNIPRFRRSTFGTQAFSVAGPTVWNSLPYSLRDPALESERFRRDLRTNLFAGH